MKKTLENLHKAAGLAMVLMAGPSLAADDAVQFSTEKAPVQVETLASGLDNPWSVEVMPDGAFIVTELGGKLRTHGLPLVAKLVQRAGRATELHHEQTCGLFGQSLLVPPQQR